MLLPRAVLGVITVLSACGEGPSEVGLLDAGAAGPRDGGLDVGRSSELCREADRFVPVFAATTNRWDDQDELAPGPAEPLVFVGSSSIRRWEGLSRSFSDHRPLQRGFGGAQAGEVARKAQALVLRHDPRGVVVFAGTNDVAAGVPAAIVVDRIRCLRARVAEAFGVLRPVFFIGITPTPARWNQWAVASEVNARVQTLAASDPGLVYIDIPTAFLAGGVGPPDDRLFVEDRLHLSAEGYARWTQRIRDVVDAVLSPVAEAMSGGDGLEPGDRVLMDFGPDDGRNGALTTSPDGFGRHWNNWPGRPSGRPVVPGEHLENLVTTAGRTTAVGVAITGGFDVNGYQHGGLRTPDPERLGALAVPTASGDFVYSQARDRTGGFYLRGLDPNRIYTLRFFASRAADERRSTRFDVHGAQSVSVLLQTSGPGASANGGHGNDDDVAVVRAAPDAWGHLFVDLNLEGSSYAYLNAFELAAD